ncbi:pentatricopeptide repeat-containing protein At5g46100-like [Pistacia vera]|uniref:pentatricopeptide repeat-containing protein At5g46100-like n=1 Tax=Pistacia vera TaxID=55513 RepID=UPI001263568C|nr:pentatricopeptide repeat-containing protein At5g46100-like [Pistacia vera]XP_031286842.1 pentatricopeptide repeat-containing protein At5g46100-like [Pistacia vera]
MGAKSMLKWSKQITPAQVVQLIRAEKDVNKALVIFDSATAEYANGFKHDEATFGLMISRLVSANHFKQAEDLLDRMKKESCNIKENILLSICRGYGRVHRPVDAIRVFHRMKEFECEPTEKSYVTVFDILVEENQLRTAFRFYKYMKKMGIPTSVASLNVLIKALCKNSGTIDAAIRIFHEMPNRWCTPDSYTYGTLINGLCRLGKIDEAKELFKEMEIKGCSPSVVTYTSLIHGLCKCGNVDEATGLFEEMRSKGIEPNVFTYSSLMDGLCKEGCSSQAMELFEMMISKRHRPNVITYSILMNGLCKEGKLREAVEILDRMKLQGFKPDAGLYGKIITGFCDISKFQEAANFLDEMVLQGISPNRLTWSLHARIHNTVVQGLCKSDANRAFQVYLCMRTRGISIEAGTYGLLITCFCKKGDLHKAARIVDEMVLDGCVPDEGTWSVVVSGFWDRQKVRQAAQVELINKFVEHEEDIRNQDA